MGREMYERNRVGFVALWVEDLGATREAIRAALGLEVRFEDAEVVVFAMEGTDFVLRHAAGESAGRAGQTAFGFYRDNLDAATGEMRAAGAAIVADRLDIGAGQRATVIRLPGGQTVEVVGR